MLEAILGALKLVRFQSEKTCNFGDSNVKNYYEYFRKYEVKYEISLL